MKHLLISLLMLVFAAGVCSATLLMDYDDGNAGNGIHQADLNGGGFDDTVGTVDALVFTDHVNWFQPGGLQTDQASRTNIGDNGAKTDGSLRSAVLTAVRSFASPINGVGYTISTGDSYNLSFVWRDALNWVDASGQVTMQLAYYATEGGPGFDPIADAYTPFASYSAPVSTVDNTWEAAGTTNWGSAPAAAAGKTLYVVMTASSGFGRADNITLEAIPEPFSAQLLFAALGVFALVRRRMAR